MAKTILWPIIWPRQQVGIQLHDQTHTGTSLKFCWSLYTSLGKYKMPLMKIKMVFNLLGRDSESFKIDDFIFDHNLDLHYSIGAIFLLCSICVYHQNFHLIHLRVTIRKTGCESIQQYTQISFIVIHSSLETQG
jgi:hypothetical protein